jgi:hypothetical protein
MDFKIVHLLAGSDCGYLQTLANWCEIIVIRARNTRILGYHLLRFQDIEFEEGQKMR